MADTSRYFNLLAVLRSELAIGISAAGRIHRNEPSVGAMRDRACAVRVYAAANVLLRKDRFSREDTLEVQEQLDRLVVAIGAGG